METITRFFRIEHQSFFLLGPRGTGKSTFVRATFPGALYIDLLQGVSFDPRRPAPDVPGPGVHP